MDTEVPDCKTECLPGRIAGLSHPMNKGRTILLADREHLWPDVVTVFSSGVSCFPVGTVLVLKPDSGAFWKKFGGREARIIGVSRPWWESVLGTLDEDGFHPGPGYCLVDRETVTNKDIELLERFYPYGKCLESCGDGFTDPLKDERVLLNEGMWKLDLEERDFYTFEGWGKDSYALQWADIASKSWLHSLES